MSKQENPVFQRGETFFGIGGTVDSTSGKQHEGQEYIWEDIDYSNTSGALVKPTRTELPVVTRIVRNAAAVTALPKRLARLSLTNHGQIDGHVAVEAAGPLVVVDEHLPSAGCVQNDLCHVVVQGPSLVTTSLAADAGNVINAGDRVVGATGATSGATTAGRAKVQDLTGATAPLGNNIQNAVGVAMSAKTTANTGVDLLIQVRRF
jgi:hypothetical protein